MANGADKNLIRLAICVSEYRAKHKEWPTEARLAPFLLWDIAHLLTAMEFEQLAERLPLSSASDGRCAPPAETKKARKREPPARTHLTNLTPYQLSCLGTLWTRLIGGWPPSALCGLRVSKLLARPASPRRALR